MSDIDPVGTVSAFAVDGAATVTAAVVATVVAATVARFVVR